MEFKEAYLLLGNNIEKYRGKILEHKKSDNTFEIKHIYIGLKNPTPEDFKIIKKNKIDFLGGVNTKVYSLLKDKPCNIFFQLKSNANNIEKEVALEELENEFHLSDM